MRKLSIVKMWVKLDLECGEAKVNVGIQRHRRQKSGGLGAQPPASLEPVLKTWVSEVNPMPKARVHGLSHYIKKGLVVVFGRLVIINVSGSHGLLFYNDWPQKDQDCFPSLLATFQGEIGLFPDPGCVYVCFFVSLFSQFQWKCAF